ncbi:MAG: hypothetical protein AAGF11_00640 [Myxococcota bacterium]
MIEADHAPEGGVPIRSATSPSSDPRIVVMDGDPQSARDVVRVMRAITGDVYREGSMTAAAEGVFDLLLVNYEPLDSRSRECLVEAFPELTRRGKVLLYADPRQADHFGLLLQRIGLTNFIASDHALDWGELLVTARKLLGADPFAVEKYLTWGAKVQRSTLRSSGEIEPLVRSAIEFAREANALRRIVMQYGNVVSELLSNALYNAPRDPRGRPLHQHRSRRDEVSLPADDEAELCLAFDGTHLAVSVRDPYGSLTADKVLAYLAKCFRGGPEQIDQKAGGAGLGLYCAFTAVSRLVFNVAPGRSTEAIGLLDVRGSYRDFARRGKSFNVFVEEASD